MNGEKRNAYKLLVEKKEDLDVGEWIILRLILERLYGWYGLDWSSSG
jgi:hypothetical protein